MIPSYVFVLGRTPNLSLAEIIHTYPKATSSLLMEHAALIENSEIDPQKCIELLGGTVTISKVLSSIDEFTVEALTQEIITDIGGGSITFSVSSLGQQKITEAFLSQVKKELSARGISSRYIINTGEHTLSAIVIKGQHVQEYIVIPKGEQYVVTKTVAVQTIPSWVKREYDRPHADPKRGMLPPKVARMLVNIASSYSDPMGPRRLLDPFCGMGTVLAEAMLLGWNVVGSDISESVAANARENLTWLREQYKELENITFDCFALDAVHVSKRIEPESITAIVTEPFLGSPTFATQKNVSMESVRNTIKGLEKLYIGALKDWHSVLVPNGIVIIAFPEFSVNGHELFVKKVIDSCETLGYSIEEGPYPYGRPGATVKRLFYILRRK